MLKCFFVNCRVFYIEFEKQSVFDFALLYLQVNHDFFFFSDSFKWITEFTKNVQFLVFNKLDYFKCLFSCQDVRVKLSKVKFSILNFLELRFLNLFVDSLQSLFYVFITDLVHFELKLTLLELVFGELKF